MKERGPYYLESNSVVHPNLKCIDDIVFTNQVFVTSGNGDKVKPVINKMVVEDNKAILKEGFSQIKALLETI